MWSPTPTSPWCRSCRPDPCASAERFAQGISRGPCRLKPRPQRRRGRGWGWPWGKFRKMACALTGIHLRALRGCGPARFFCASPAYSLRAVSGPAGRFRRAATSRRPYIGDIFCLCSLSFADTPEFYAETGCIVGCMQIWGVQCIEPRPLGHDCQGGAPASAQRPHPVSRVLGPAGRVGSVGGAVSSG